MSEAGRAAAFGAQTINFEAVSDHSETVVAGHAFKNPRQRRILEFDQRAAFAADQVVVLGVSIIVFVNFAIVAAGHFAQQPRQHHVVKSPINGGAADALAVGARREPGDELIGVEVFVRGKHFLNDCFAFAREAHPSCGEVFTELICRTDGHRHRRKVTHRFPPTA